jgi:hypothetical protein
VVLFELVGSEDHPIYQSLEIENVNRQYSFIQSLVKASIASGTPFVSTNIMKALNFHAIACLHSYAGEFRPCQVVVGDYEPPAHYRVQALMDDFVNSVNRDWERSDSIALASFVLWRLNHIHPFINGNGRTARAICYFVLCVKAGGLLPGTTILPELLRTERARYVAALQAVDASLKNGGPDLAELHTLMSELVHRQLQSESNPNS